MIVHRLTPPHRRGDYSRVDIDVSPRIARQTYRSHRAAGQPPFMARLYIVGLFCDPETGRVPTDDTVRLPRLRWATDKGLLAQALGIPIENRVEPIVQRVITSGRGIRAVLDAVQTELPDCTFEEWTVLCYSLGVFTGDE